LYLIDYLALGVFCSIFGQMGAELVLAAVVLWYKWRVCHAEGADMAPSFGQARMSERLAISNDAVLEYDDWSPHLQSALRFERGATDALNARRYAEAWQHLEGMRRSVEGALNWLQNNHGKRAGDR
jgi:hypothetical protein